MIETQQTLMSATTSNYHQVISLDVQCFKSQVKLIIIKVCLLLQSFSERELSTSSYEQAPL